MPVCCWGCCAAKTNWKIKYTSICDWSQLVQGEIDRYMKWPNCWKWKNNRHPCNLSQDTTSLMTAGHLPTPNPHSTSTGHESTFRGNIKYFLRFLQKDRKDPVASLSKLAGQDCLKTKRQLPLQHQHHTCTYTVCLGNVQLSVYYNWF